MHRELHHQGIKYKHDNWLAAHRNASQNRRKREEQCSQPILTCAGIWPELSLTTTFTKNVMCSLITTSQDLDFKFPQKDSLVFAPKRLTGALVQN